MLLKRFSGVSLVYPLPHWKQPITEDRVSLTTAPTTETITNKNNITKPLFSQVGVIFGLTLKSFLPASNVENVKKKRKERGKHIMPKQTV